MSLASWLLRNVLGISRRSTVGVTTGATIVNNRPPVYPDSDLDTFIAAYCTNISIRTIVGMAARKFASLKWDVYKVENEKKSKQYKQYGKFLNKDSFLTAKRLIKKAYEELKVDNDLSRLIKRPNPTQGQDSFLESIYSDYLICGEAFIWLNRGDIGDVDDITASLKPVLEMYRLAPQNMQIVPDETDMWGVSYYLFDTGGGQLIKFRKADIIHWRNFNPNFDGTFMRSHLRGLALLKSGMKVLTQDEDSTDAAVAQYQNGGAKKVLTNKTLAPLTPVQEGKLQEVIDSKINNKAAKATVATLQGDWTVGDLGDTSTDLQLLEGGRQAFIRLCNLFGVPPGLFLPDQTYENQQWQMKQLVLNLLIPAACSLRDEMNRALLPAFKITTQYTIDIDYTECPELQQEMGKLVEALMHAWWFTPNERREMMNEEQSDDPQMDEVWIPNNLTLIGDASVNMDEVVNSLNQTGMNDYAGQNRTNGNGKVSQNGVGKKVQV